MNAQATSPAQVLQLFVEHIHSGNVVAALTLYEPHAVMVEQPGQIARGEQEIFAALNRLVNSGVRLHIDVTQVLSAANIAFVASSWRVYASQAADAPIVAQGKGTDVMRQQANGSWKFLIDNPFAAKI